MLGTLTTKSSSSFWIHTLVEDLLARKRSLRTWRTTLIFLFVFFCKLFKNKVKLEIISPSQKLKWEHKLNASDEVFTVHNSSIGKVMSPSVSRDRSCAF